MKVSNFTSNAGNTVANQFLIKEGSTHTFQSYGSTIAVIKHQHLLGCYDANGKHKAIVTLDERYWDYSRTTGKYRNQFLGETISETRAKIKSGEYKLRDLN